jgi:phosphoribosylformimino-5-aminoimidazole carboxamide ribotide isomerase
MLLIIPAIELRNGVCTRFIEGEPGTEFLYSACSETPERLLTLLRRENAKTVYITDRDDCIGCDNALNARRIEAFVELTDIPITLLAGFRTVEECRYWLDRGIYRIVVSRLARIDPEGARRLLQDYTPSRVVGGAVAEHGKVLFHDDLPAMTDIEFGRYLYSLGFRRLVYTDRGWEGNLSGPSTETLAAVARQTKLRITSAGGVASISDIRALQSIESLGVDSVVVGRALFENRFPCQKIWRIAEAKLEKNTQ